MNNTYIRRWSSFTFKNYWREMVAVLMILLAVFFIRSERRELHAMGPQLAQADLPWLIAGIAVALACIFLQAGMYRLSFAAIGLRLKWMDAAALFLKRNFISVFLPAGGVSALAYSPSQVRDAGFSRTQVHQASGLFAFAGLLTVFIVGLPVVVLTVLNASLFKSAWPGLVVLSVLLGLLVWGARSLRQKGWLYVRLSRRFPSFAPALEELFAANVHTGKFTVAVGFSIGVELTGIAQLAIAMAALGHPVSIEAAAAGYIIAILMMVISPFLRGLGAVELSMVYVLEQFGYNAAQALSVTMLYRILEFWFPLCCGLLAFAWKGRRFFFRVAPALLTFGLGVVNIISAITPPLRYRMVVLREYLPLSAIHASNMLVLLVGLSLLVTAAFLFRGLRAAWVLALVFSLVSFFGHLGKALDYEEAIIALVIITMLLFTRSEYRVRGSRKWRLVGLQVTAAIFAAVCIFTFIGFYFIDQRHFGENFTWQQSFIHTFRMFLLVTDTSIHPITQFGHEFTWLIRILGLLTWGFLVFSLIRPGRGGYETKEEERQRAQEIVEAYGVSSMDYFKVGRDKLFFFSAMYEAFIAFRVTGGFAVVLEEPVGSEVHKPDVLAEFEKYCRQKGLKPVFYRTDEASLPGFMQLKKQKLIIGQEGIMDISKFSLEGKDKKSLRNGLSGLQKKGYTVQVRLAPHNSDFITQLQKVSDEWLEHFGVEELVFSQGLFNKEELAGQDVITVEDTEGHIKAFLNIIPDYAEAECTYDLIRKTNDAPGAAMDALIVQLAAYAQERHYHFINLGMVPMTGVSQAPNTPEQLIRLAADHLKRFRHYKGLKEFKDKYATIWENKYLIYDHDFDLLQLPVVLNNVMKP